MWKLKRKLFYHHNLKWASNTTCFRSSGPDQVTIPTPTISSSVWVLNQGNFTLIMPSAKTTGWVIHIIFPLTTFFMRSEKGDSHINGVDIAPLPADPLPDGGQEGNRYGILYRRTFCHAGG